MKIWKLISVFLFCSLLSIITKGQSNHAEILHTPKLTDTALVVDVFFNSPILQTNKYSISLKDSGNNSLITVDRKNYTINNTEMIISFPFNEIFNLKSITNLGGISITQNHNSISIDGNSEIRDINSSYNRKLYFNIIKPEFKEFFVSDYSDTLNNSNDKDKETIAKNFYNRNPNELITLNPNTKKIFINSMSKENPLGLIQNFDPASLIGTFDKVDSIAPNYFNRKVLDKLGKPSQKQYLYPKSEMELLFEVIINLGKENKDLLAEVISSNIDNETFESLFLKYSKLKRDSVEKIINKLDDKILNNIAKNYYSKYVDSIKNLKSFFPNNLVQDLASNYFSADENRMKLYSKFGNFSNDSSLYRKKDSPMQNTYVFNNLRDTLIQKISYSFESPKNPIKKYTTVIDTLSSFESKDYKVGLNVSIDENALADKLSHHVNYFNMDKYFGIGLTCYKQIYFNQFSFNAQTRIDTSYKFQPIVFSSIETYWIRGVNADFGIAINKFSDFGFWKKFNVGIYTGAEYINHDKFIDKDQREKYNSYYDWEIGIALNKSFQNYSNDKRWIGFNLRLPVTYRKLIDSGTTQTAFSPQGDLILNWQKFNFQFGGQYHISESKLPISNGNVWLKIFYKLNRN